ncbi:MAG: hydroxymethylglutaryl-CoA lyase [Alphaproteobacteria bacterium]|nr:hydroxymethylglutaryl-CoA lyase [Alphaproteobacteria bacterium]
MSDLPRRVEIHEEGPREGFQIEPGPIASADKVRLIEALAETGLKRIDCVSFVDPKRVPGQADAAEVAAAIRKRPGVRYTGLWLNTRGFERARQTQLDLSGRALISASDLFSLKNSGKDNAASLAEQRGWLKSYRELGMAVEWATVMTAFGCNFEGRIAPAKTVERIGQLLALVAEEGFALKGVLLADTVGFAAPNGIEATVGAVRSRWPDLRIGLHLHDTRGTGLANAYAALRMGIERFDGSCAGLGGCPFAGHKGAAGNICTEDLVFMCHELGIETGIDLERLIECARLAETIVGHPLPGKVMKGGSLQSLRARS